MQLLMAEMLSCLTVGAAECNTIGAKCWSRAVHHPHQGTTSQLLHANTK